MYTKNWDMREEEWNEGGREGIFEGGWEGGRRSI